MSDGERVHAYTETVVESQLILGDDVSICSVHERCWLAGTRQQKQVS
jgi:hypothetical protein